NIYAIGADLDGSRCLDDIGQALHAHPYACITAHGPAMQTEVQVFLHAGWKPNRYHRRFQDVLALMRQRRRFGRVVVARQYQYTSARRRAGGIGMLENIAATVYPRPLAVPHTEHPIVPRAAVQVYLLRTPYRGGRQFFVQPWLEGN